MRRVPLDPDRLIGDNEYELPEEAAHYVNRVLRLRPGSIVELFDGEGHAVTAELLENGRVRTDRVRAVKPKPPRIVLFHAPPKGDRWEWLLEKATELGVDEIQPIETGRGVVRIPTNKIARKVERWRSIVTAASRQSGRYHAPVVHEPLPFDDALDQAPGGFFGDPRAGIGLTSLLLEAPLPAVVGIWIGPEGGWTEDEEAKLGERGVRGAHIGDHVLRSETAGILMVGVVRLLAGRA